MRRWLVALAAAVVASAVGVSINVATDLKTNGWAWVAVVVLTVAVAGVAVWTQRPSREPSPVPGSTNNLFSGKAGTLVQGGTIGGSVHVTTTNTVQPISAKRVAVGVGITVALMAVYFVFATLRDNNIDQVTGTPPFKAQFLFDSKVPRNWAFVLDRKLTPTEIAGLEKLDGEDGQAVWDYLRPLGGRLVPKGDQPPALEDGTTETFHMSLLSNRHTTLTIENISVANVKCTPSTAVTLIDFPSQGNTEVDGVAFMLRAPNKPMMQVGDGGVTDHDYFAKHQIDLGAGATAGALIVTSIGRHGMSCSWDFTADYATADDQSTLTFNNDGRPLTLESPPDQPLQHIEFGSGAPDQSHPWYDCADPGAQC
jgi:hypothetical protein